jgi:CheY-like chemotaxis protein
MTLLPRVLVIDDDPAALQTTQAQLLPEGYDFIPVPAASQPSPTSTPSPPTW